MFKTFRKQNTWDLIWQLFRTDFRLRYNDSVLGFLWVLIKPFSIFLIMYFVLTKVFPSNQENFALYLLLGNVFFTFWSEGTGMGMESLLNRASLITKINFPRYTVLISATAMAAVNFLINMVIVTVFAIVSNVIPSFTQIVWFIFCASVLYFLILVVSMFLSVFYVRFRDLKQIWELFNQLLFWSTPIFYSVDALIHKSWLLEIIILKLNPVSVFLTSARSAVLHNDILLQTEVFSWLAGVTFFAVMGYFFYKRSIRKIAEYF